MYNKGNPILIAGGQRRKIRVGSTEFSRCPDGSVVTGIANATSCAGRGWPTPSTNPGNPNNYGNVPLGWLSPLQPGGGGYEGPSYPKAPGPVPMIPIGPPNYNPTPMPPTGSPWSPPSVPVGFPMTPMPPVGYPPPALPPMPSPPIMGPPVCQPSSGCQTPIQVCPENLKRYYMPFVPDAGFTATVLAGAQVRFVGNPQKLFSPDQLIVASTIAPFFDIVSLSIGNTLQSLSAGNVAADMFSEVSTLGPMSFDQAYPGIAVILVAQNKSSVTQTFQAQLVGQAIG